MDYTKWVACWGCGTSITNQKEARFAKDLTLRYPIQMCFSGNALRFRFSNVTGKEPVTLRASAARWLLGKEAGTAHRTKGEKIENYDEGSMNPKQYDTGNSRPKWFDTDSLIDASSSVSITVGG